MDYPTKTAIIMAKSVANKLTKNQNEFEDYVQAALLHSFKYWKTFDLGIRC